MYRKVIGLPAMTLAAVAFAGPGVAAADYTDYYWGPGYTNGVTGARHTLSYNQAVNNNPAYWSSCVNALNESGTSWVTTSVCGTDPSIGLCACALRYPWAGYPTGTYISAYAGYRSVVAAGAASQKKPSLTALAGYGSTNRPLRASARISGVATSGQLSADLTTALPSLRKPAVTSVPDDLRLFAEQHSSYGIDPGQARAVRPVGVDGSWFVLPGKGNVCLVRTGVGEGYDGTCARSDDAKAGRLFVQFVKPPASTDGGALPAAGEAVQSTTVGLVPQGATVSAARADGAASAVVSDGTFSVTGANVASIGVGSNSQQQALPIVAAR